MSAKLTDYDARQINLMTRTLNAFDHKEIDLGQLISSLDGIQNALQDVGETWRNAFLRQWGVLEDIYADALDKNTKQLPAEHTILINRALIEIRRLISEQI